MGGVAVARRPGARPGSLGAAEVRGVRAVRGVPTGVGGRPGGRLLREIRGDGRWIRRRRWTRRRAGLTSDWKTCTRTPRGGGCDPRRARPARRRGREDTEEARPASRRQRPAPARGAARGKARQHRPVRAVQPQRELPPQGHAQGVQLPGVGRGGGAGEMGPGARERGATVTDERNEGRGRL